MAELVGLNVQTPDVFGKLSQLLTIRGQQQGLQGQAAQVQQEQQTARQRDAMSKYDWNKHIGEDGTFDLNTLNDPELMAAAGDGYLDIVQNAVTAKASQLDAKSKLVGLRHDQREEFAALMGGLRGDPDVAEDNEKGRQKVTEALVQYGEMYGEDVLPILEAYAKPLQNAPKGRMADAIKAIQMQAASASEQLEKQRPQYTSTGARLVQTNPYTPGAQEPRSQIPIEIGPGLSPFTDPRTGNPYLINQQTGGVSDLGQGFPGRGPSPTAPPNTPTGGPAPPVSPNASPTAPTRPSSMPAPYYPGQAEDIKTQQADVQNIRTAAEKAPTNRHIYEHVLRLSDDTSSGPAVAYLQKNPVIGQMFGDNYQEMAKYLERTAIENMQAMGGAPSDARLDAAVKASGSTTFNAPALKAVTRFNYATNTALEQFRHGIDKAVGTQNPDYAKLPEFKSNWAKNFDIDVFRVENAKRSGDQAELARIKKELHGNPERARELAEKARNIESLATTGRLP